MMDILGRGLVELAQYQPGVGTKVLKQINWPANVPKGDLSTAEIKRMAEAALEGIDTERWEKFNALVEAEQAEAVKIIAAINSARPRQ
jgi:hypothetical protein